jgi:large subunit ribosomal protein L20
MRLARTAITKAGVHAYTGRKLKKRQQRGIWNISINAAVRPNGLSYSQFIDKLKKKKIDLNRKTLSTLAKDYPAVFKKLIEVVK